MILLWYEINFRRDEGRGGGGIRLKLDVHDLGGGRILDVDEQGG